MPGKRRVAAVFLLAVLAIAAILFLAAGTLVVSPRYLHEERVKCPGSFAPLYLYEHSPYDRIVIEVHYMADARPSPGALGHLRSMLQEYTGRPADVYMFEDISPAMIPARTDRNNMSTFGQDFIGRNARYRAGWLGGNATIYVLYVDIGDSDIRPDGGGVVAGMSFRADAFFVFATSIPDERLEHTVLMHEAGHLLGLEHDRDQGCVMVEALKQNRSQLIGFTHAPGDYCPEHQKQLAYSRRHLLRGPGDN